MAKLARLSWPICRGFTSVSSLANTCPVWLTVTWTVPGELAHRYDNHPIDDMIYVALAERTPTELVTADEALRRRLTHVDWIVDPDQAAI